MIEILFSLQTLTNVLGATKAVVTTSARTLKEASSVAVVKVTSSPQTARDAWVSDFQTLLTARDRCWLLTSSCVIGLLLFYLSAQRRWEVGIGNAVSGLLSSLSFNRFILGAFYFIYTWGRGAGGRGLSTVLNVFYAK